MSDGCPIEARCPAKVNLVLRVLDRRPDGFHELDTVFQAIDWWDRVLVEPSPELEVTCDDRSVPSGPDNLAWQAANALRERHAPHAGGARIRILKRIPMQAGLGGGSSDAAGTLLACARLWSIRPDRAALAAIGAELGSDIPFFLWGGTARGRGRGERIEPLAFAGSIVILVGIPPFGCSTAEVYGGVAARLTLPGNAVSVPVFSGHKWAEKKDFGFVGNDLEQVAFDLRPELRRLRDELVGAGAARALLSGSGSAVFGLFDSDEAASAAADRVGSSFGDWRFVRTRTERRGAHLLS